MAKPGERIFMVGFSVLFVGSGIFLTWWAQASMAEGRASKKWPSTQGRVISSKVHTYDNDGTTMYRPEVAYSYAVNGATYTSDRITMTHVATNRSGYARDMVARFPAGAAVQVRYDPTDPAKAVLVPGRQWTDGLVFLGGIAFLCTGLYMLRVSLRRDLGEGSR
jgi:hypothetical protein